MNVSSWTKQIVTLGVISCGLVWMALGTLVLPMHDRARQISAEHDRLSSQVEARSAVNDTQTRLPERLESLLTSADHVGQVWALTESKRSVYDHVSGLAEEIGVVVESIEPTLHRRVAAASPRSGADASVQIESIGYQIAMQGTYAQITEYIRRLELEFGLTSISGFEIRPDARLAPGMVRCSLSTQHTIREPDILTLRDRIADAGLEIDGGAP
jgi:hypothetical protein